MTKKETKVLKGVAILFMLFLHLFNHFDNWVDITIADNIRLMSFLAEATNPVSFYLLLGGVGMYFLYKRGGNIQWKRVLKLYIHYWIVLILFVSIGWLMNRSGYPGNFVKIVSNITGFKTSYNAECWFLLPYVILTFISPYLFYCLDRWPKLTLSILFPVNILTMYIISRYGGQYLYRNMWIYNSYLVIHMSFTFILGATLIKYWDYTEHIIERLSKLHYLNWMLLIVLVIVRCILSTDAVTSFYVLLFVIIFLSAPRWKWVDKSLAHLGDHSMTMWLIHTWFCKYLFHDFIYSFRYPPHIFFALLLLTYFTSHIVKLLAHPIVKRI